MSFEYNNCQGTADYHGLDDLSFGSEEDFSVSFSSFMINPTLEVDVYSDANWNDFVGHYIGRYKHEDTGIMPCFQIGGNSIRLYRVDPDDQKITAEWVKIGSGYNFEHEVTTSTINSHGEQMTKTDEDNFTYEMNAGVQIGKVTLGGKFGQSWTDTMTS